MDEFKDDFIKDIMQKGQSKITNRTFDDEVMSKIMATSNYKQEVHHKLMLSFKLFKVALIIGILATLIFLFDYSLFEHNGTTLALIVLFIIATIGILNIENYRRLLSMYDQTI